MTPDDPRHGKWTGYNAGCRDACCREAARRYQARLVHDRHNGRPRTFDITGTRRRVRALMRIGWSAELIAQHAGVSMSSIQALTARPTLHVVYRKTKERIDRVYNELARRPGPSKASVIHAIRLGYASPAAWEDGTIDDPSAEPIGLDDGKPAPGSYDQSRVERRILGDRSIKLHKGEAAEVVRRLLADGWSQNAIAQHTGINTTRYVEVAA